MKTLAIAHFTPDLGYFGLKMTTESAQSVPVKIDLNSNGPQNLPNEDKPVGELSLPIVHSQKYVRVCSVSVRFLTLWAPNDGTGQVHRRQRTFDRKRPTYCRE